MNPSRDEIQAIVQERVTRLFPDVIVEFRPAVDDDATICVRVFGARAEDVEPIEELVFDAEDELTSDRPLSLLPMVKTIETTRQHYPELHQRLGQQRVAKSTQAVAQLLAAQFPHVMLKCRPSVDDDRILCMRVFGALDEEIGGIKAAIRKYSHAQQAETGLLLLPMVKTIETTRQHYPELYRQLETQRAERSMQAPA
jgi:hypothetical protein